MSTSSSNSSLRSKDDIAVRAILVSLSVWTFTVLLFSAFWILLGVQIFGPESPVLSVVLGIIVSKYIISWIYRWQYARVQEYFGYARDTNRILPNRGDRDKQILLFSFGLGLLFVGMFFYFPWVALYHKLIPNHHPIYILFYSDFPFIVKTITIVAHAFSFCSLLVGLSFFSLFWFRLSPPASCENCGQDLERQVDYCSNCDAELSTQPSRLDHLQKILFG